MHFNSLGMQLRTQALAAIASVVTISGLALSFAGKSARPVQWRIFSGAIRFLAIAWLALAVLDIFYYDKLLTGAVNAILEHESRTPLLKDGAGQPIKVNGVEVHRINLSTRIDKAVTSPPRFWVVLGFYSIVFLGLVIGALFTHQQSKDAPGAQSADDSEQKFAGNASLDVRLTMAPPVAAPEASVETPAPAVPNHKENRGEDTRQQIGARPT